MINYFRSPSAEKKISDTPGWMMEAVGSIVTSAQSVTLQKTAFVVTDRETAHTHSTVIIR